MWLYLPRTSASSPDALASTSPSASQFQMLAVSATSKGKLAQPAYWRRAWKMGALNLLRSGLTCEPSHANSIVAEWLDSLAAFPAPTSPSPASALESPESTLDSGSNTSASFARCGPNGSLLRTCPQSSLFPREEPYSEGLPKAGSMRNGYLFERPTWEPRTGASESLSSPGDASWKTPHGMSGIDHTGKVGGGGEFAKQASQWPSPRSEDAESCGNHPDATDSLTGASTLWRTPDAPGDGGPRNRGRSIGKGHQITIAEQAELWQTPATDSFRSRGGDRKDEMGLDQQARLAWPTPAERDHRSPNLKPYSERGGQTKGEQLPNFVSHSFPQDPPTATDGLPSSPSAPGSRRRLNPAFAASLMGLPWWWTRAEPISSAPSETASFLSRARQHLSNYFEGLDDA